MRYHIIESLNHRHSASDKQIEPCSELLDRLAYCASDPREQTSRPLDSGPRPSSTGTAPERSHRHTMLCDCSGIQNSCDEAIRETLLANMQPLVES